MMPICTMRFVMTKGQQRGEPFSPGLIKDGPVVQVEVAVPSLLAEYLAKKKLPIPQPVKGFALFDSGASTSCVDSQIVHQLGVKPIAVTTVLTAGGPEKQNCYPARFIFREPKLVFHFSLALGVNLRGQSAMGRNLIALVGRDVLSRGVFVYNGINAMATFAF